jgi:ubiquitin C-terminal hydrolase
VNALKLYRLRGVVVHSGVANGGHYYSFIRDAQSTVYCGAQSILDGDFTGMFIIIDRFESVSDYVFSLMFSVCVCNVST